MEDLVMPKIVIDTSNAALVEQLRICRLAKGKLDKDDQEAQDYHPALY